MTKLLSWLLDSDCMNNPTSVSQTLFPRHNRACPKPLYQDWHGWLYPRPILYPNFTKIGSIQARHSLLFTLLVSNLDVVQPGREPTPKYFILNLSWLQPDLKLHCDRPKNCLACPLDNRTYLLDNKDTFKWLALFSLVSDLKHWFKAISKTKWGVGLKRW